MSDDYRAALTAAIQEYESLGAKRREIDERLGQLAQTIGTLSRLLGLTPTVPLGLTDACRLVLIDDTLADRTRTHRGVCGWDTSARAALDVFDRAWSKRRRGVV